MKYLPLLLLFALGCRAEEEDPAPAGGDPASDAPIEPYDPLDLVDPFIATGGNGAEIANINPGATLPNGMALTGPDTRTPGLGAPSFYHCAGYWWHDTHIHGFSHTHAHGIGIPDYGAIAFLPRDGWDDAYTTMIGRMAPFDHDEEFSRPGNYRVKLQDDGTWVDIAAGVRGAISRITWEQGADPVILFDMGQRIDRTEVLEGRVSFTPGEAEVVGFQRLAGGYSERFGGLRTHFVAELDPAPIGGGAWDSADAPVAGETSAEGVASGVWLTFPPGTTQVELRLAISYVDHDGARNNLADELRMSFEDRIAENETIWRERLEPVRVRGTDEDMVRFHTAMYHASIMPSRYDDADGRYRGVDGEIHTTTHPYYSDLSLWDTFRTLHPWYIHVWPELQQDMVRSLLRMVADGGWLPRWPMAHGYTGGMISTPAIQVITETWWKGLRDWDEDAAWDAMLVAATQRQDHAGRAAVEQYVEHGFVPLESAGGSVSRTLENAWADHALALFAEARGEPEAEQLWDMSGSWRNVWYAEAGFNVGRCLDPENTTCNREEDGKHFAWLGNTDRWEGYYIEGNAYHYRWFTPYDVDAMIAYQSPEGRDAWHDTYQDYWEMGVFREEYTLAPDVFYWHGNEPVMHYAFLGSLSGRPDLTAPAARWVLRNRYSNEPAGGLDGNDDSGTLSAWYLLASTGFFPVAGTPDYAVASPIFSRVEIDRPDGTWVMRAPGMSEEAMFVTGFALDGDPWGAAVVDYDALFGARDVELRMADAPGAWPTAP